MSKTPKNIIEFIESESGLGFSKQGYSLYPVQKFILKMTYNIPLDDTERCISVPKTWEGITTYSFTEKEYLSYLYDEGRCNTKYQINASELVLAAGRRGGKSTLSHMMVAYELYKLMTKSNPQAYYGLPEGSTIGVSAIATSLDQAHLFSKYVRDRIKESPLAQFQKSSTDREVVFSTPQDMLEGNDPSIRFRASSCVSTPWGVYSIAAIFEEVAFFKEKLANQKFQEILPSFPSFTPKNPANPSLEIGPCEAKLILMSSPYKKEGLFYNRFQNAMNPLQFPNSSLALQIPTWEMNPSVPRIFYERFSQKTDHFDAEFGAKFISSK